MSIGIVIQEVHHESCVIKNYGQLCFYKWRKIGNNDSAHVCPKIGALSQLER